jgi:hypothetical protein
VAHVTFVIRKQNITDLTVPRLCPLVLLLKVGWWHGGAWRSKENSTLMGGGLFEQVAEGRSGACGLLE